MANEEEHVSLSELREGNHTFSRNDISVSAQYPVVDIIAHNMI